MLRIGDFEVQFWWVFPRVAPGVANSHPILLPKDRACQGASKSLVIGNNMFG